MSLFIQTESASSTGEVMAANSNEGKFHLNEIPSIDFSLGRRFKKRAPALSTRTHEMTAGNLPFPRRTRVNCPLAVTIVRSSCSSIPLTEAIIRFLSALGKSNVIFIS